MNSDLNPKALPEIPPLTGLAPQVEGVSLRPAIEAKVASLWRDLLGVPTIDPDDNFFDVGGTSLLITMLLTRLNQAFAARLSIDALFDAPTIRSMAALIADTAFVATAPAPVAVSQTRETPNHPQVAIIAMTGRFPGADTVEQFWSNLCTGTESITWFAQDQLEDTHRTGPPPEGYIPARPILADPSLFDAAFFNIYPREAELMDPQHRIFLECAWEVMERAGYDPGRMTEQVGVFAGSSMNTYLMHNLAGGRDFLENFTGGYQVGEYPTMMGNDKDFLPTRVSYKLNLRGPSVAVQTACSTSLVAVCQACQSLLTEGCDMALAGAVSITFPQRRGYVPQEGGIVSTDGHCRPFDHRANGTVFGSGAAVLLLKRLDDAVRDGDQVLGVIRGFAINNDGAQKVGYTAPSVEGQAQVIERALKIARVPAESIGYLEAHGTATPLGDPIEIAALTRAYRKSTGRTGFCAIGTAKANVGHLDVAAGATGLIKSVLQLQHRTIPKLLHFEAPNPHLRLAETPFHVPLEATAWSEAATPRRAGVSAFGIGGTNAHLIVEEAPALEHSSPDANARPHLLVWSAKTPEALAEMTRNLAQHLATNPEASLADTAYTLQLGRAVHTHRRTAVAASAQEAATLLAEPAPATAPALDSPSIVFCFPGQGVQGLGMGRQLFDTEPVFRDTLLTCAAKLQPRGIDLIALLYPADSTPEAAAKLNDTMHAQSAIFAVEYALAQLWLSWGIRPDAMVGHSVGELVAVCIAGALTLDDALHLVAERGRLMQSMPRGAMLAVRADEAAVIPRMAALPDQPLDLAAVNGPKLCVVSGPDAAIEALAADLAAHKIAARKLSTSHAFHSRMMDGVLPAFEALLHQAHFGPLTIPVISTLTGKPLTAEQIAEPSYWLRQLRHTVRFAAAIETLAQIPDRLFLELGPSGTLVQPIRQILRAAPKTKSDPVVIASAADSGDTLLTQRSMLQALGRLWTAGITPDWQALHAGTRRHRVLLPTYPFQRKSFWIAPPAREAAASAPTAVTPQIPDIPKPEEPLMATLNPASALPANTAATFQEVQALIADLSGVDLTGTDPEASFLELGFDSLFLTQLTQEIQGKYKVKLTFRQIMESFPTVKSLAEHVDATAVRATPPAAAAPVTATTPIPAATFAAPAASATSQGATSLESLFAAQTQALATLFQQQLAALGSQPAPAPTPGPVPKPALAPPPPVTGAAAAPTKPIFVPFKPLHRGDADGLDPAQQLTLDTFTTAYNQRTAGSKAFTQHNRHILADGRVVSGFHPQLKELIYPLVVERAKGAYLWDTDGNRFIDILNGFGAILFGHSPDFLLDAVRTQLDLGFPVGPQTPLVAECSELVRELTGMERVTFCNTGSEAVMAAMRLARTVTGRNLIVMFSGDYHGSFDEVLAKAVGGHRTMPAAPGVPRESVANMLVLDYGTPESLEIIRARASELAAVLVEPVQSRHPELRPADFLREVRSITQQSGSALIFDEVVTGFRTHPGGMQAVYGIRADLATYGKVVAGGLPIGVLAGCPTFMDALDGGAWQYGDRSRPEIGVTFVAGTFVRHPLAMAAMRASLLHLKQHGPELQATLSAKSEGLVSDIRAMFAEFAHPAFIEGFSSWFYLTTPTDPLLSRLLHFRLRHHGVHIQEGFPCFLTTAHTDADIDHIREAFRSSLTEMYSTQSLPLAAAPATLPAPDPDRRFPITQSQREILLGAEMSTEANCSFNESTSLKLIGELNEVALLSGLEFLVQRHPGLRQVFERETETAHILPTLPVTLDRDDLASLPEADQAERMQQICAHEAATPFKLNQPPLFRTRLVRLAPDRHIFLFTAHHIIFDGWSTTVFFNELSLFYNAAISGTTATLPPALTFPEFAHIEQQRLLQQDHRDTEKYWVDKFRPAPLPLALPTDRPRGPMRTFEGTTARYQFPPELFAAVRKAGARQGSTLFATLLGALSLMVHRLTDKADLTIGIPMAGQSRVPNGATLVGHCVNFLPIRTELQSGQTMAQFMKQTRTTLLDAYDHQDYTYGELLHQLRADRDTTSAPLIKVQANVDQIGANLDFTGLKADLHGNPKKFVNMDLFFNFIDRGDELWLECDYNTNLFDRATLDRWFGHLQSVLRGFVEDARQDSQQIPLLTKEQEQQILVDFNDTAAPFLTEPSIHRSFEAQVERTPSVIAISTALGQTLTYAELNEKANQLARFLIRSGVAPGSRVGLCLKRSLEAIAGILAILKVGAAYVPIDASYPEARLRFLVENAECKFILTQQAVAEKLPPLNATLLSIDHDWPAIALEEGNNLSWSAAPQAPAYVMYTSGSTGTPKGVLVPHRAVMRLVKNTNFADLTGDQVFLQLATLSFDAATFEIWGALLNGGKLILGPPDRITPEGIGQLIVEHGVTTLWLTAALFHLMVTEHLELLRPLRQLLAGGDVLSLTHVQTVLDKLPHLRLINGYGPTENTTFTCCHTITPQSLEAGTVPIGRPIANTRIYILDPQRRPVPVGIAGELCAAGDGLALGYLNAPELTADKFITHIFGNGTAERMYRTGDLARYRNDGTVEFLGRIDTQVKIRGYRVELAEIEYALEQALTVRSAVVAVRTDRVTAGDTPGDKRLVGYVVLHQPGDEAANATAIKQLREHLRTRLPDYMRPSAIMVLDRLPMTLNGKIDRNALPAPQSADREQKRDKLAPQSAEERTLAAIWASILGLPEVGVDDNIFELGGDSLLIFRITTQARQAGLNVTALQIFQLGTIASVCAQLNDPGAVPAAKKASIQAVSRSQYRRQLPASEPAVTKMSER